MHQRKGHRAGTLALVALVALACGMSSASGFAQQANSAGVDWKALTPQIEAALGSRYSDCDENSRWIDVLKTADIGVPVAFVAYCHMGAYTSDIAVVRLENGKPVPAVFRRSGKTIDPEMLDGSSVRNGTGVELFPDQHAVFSVAWHTDDDGKVDGCSGTAYAWNRKTQTFDADDALSKILSNRECALIARDENKLKSHQ